MNTYRVIVLSDGQEWACNKEGEGVFKRRNGNWHQYTGTGQTPTFKTPQTFSRYIHARYRNGDGEKLPRMKSHRGWPEV